MLNAMILHNQEISVHVRLSGQLWKCAVFQGGAYLASNYYPAELCGAIHALGKCLIHLRGLDLQPPWFSGREHLQDWVREALGLEVVVTPDVCSKSG